MNIKRTFAANVRARRKELGLTMRDVAGMAKISPSTVSQVENEKTDMQISKAEHLANTLGTTLVKLLR